jgi:hypothetical protein
LREIAAMSTLEHRTGQRGSARRTSPAGEIGGLWLVEAAVAAAYGLEARRLRGGTRGAAPVALARQVAMYVAHVRLGLDYTAIGRAFGRDRTTVAHACRLIEDRRDDPRVEDVIGRIEEAVQAWCDLVVVLGGSDA